MAVADNFPDFFMQRLIKTSIFLVILLLNSSKAQFNFYSYYQGVFDDNIFNTSNNVSDFINILSFGTAFNIESDFNNVQLYYEGNVSMFRTTTAKSFNTHRIGIVETHLFSEDDNPLNAGINYSFRNNQDEFDIFDFNQLSAYINYRHSVSETDFILPGYIFNKNNYKNFTLFSHNEHKFFINWISSFESRTSLTLNAEYLIKKYDEVYDYGGYLNEASQLKLRLNLGQSLSDFTGINLSVTYRKNFSDGSRYIISDSLIYYEEEIFNDIYSFDGIEVGGGIKHYFSEDVELVLEGKYLIRNYSALPAVDISGLELDVMRKDNSFGLGVGLTFDISTLLNGLSLSATWNYFNNSSNDYYYKYSNQIISFSLGYDF